MPVRNTIDLNGPEWTYTLSFTNDGYYITYTKTDIENEAAEIEAGDTQTLDNFLEAFAVR